MRALLVYDSLQCTVLQYYRYYRCVVFGTLDGTVILFVLRVRHRTSFLARSRRNFSERRFFYVVYGTVDTTSQSFFISILLFHTHIKSLKSQEYIEFITPV